MMAVGLLVSGCAAETPSPPSPPGAVVNRGAAAAGGACHLLDYEQLHRVLGLTFTLAASSTRETTSSCVFRPGPQSLPELSLSVSPTAADIAVFKAVVQPAGATAVTGLGKIGFQSARNADASRPASVEVGWLAGNARLLLLKLSVPEGASPTDFVSKVVELAKEVDRYSL
jgi:hypothetical protein